MVRKLILFVMFALLLVGVAKGDLIEGWDDLRYDGDKVYVNTSEYYIKAPNVTSENYIDIEYDIKNNADIYTISILNNGEFSLRKAQYYLPEVETFEYEFNCPTIEDINATRKIVVCSNTNDTEIYRGTYSQQLRDNLFLLQGEFSNDWHDFPESITRRIDFYSNKNNWAETGGIALLPNRLNKVRLWLTEDNVKPGELVKYDIIMKPFGMTRQEAENTGKLFILDPYKSGTSGVQGAWHLDGNGNDSSGNFRNLVEAGATYDTVTVKLGTGSLYFDGDADSAAMQNDTIVCRTKTINLWAFWNDTAQVETGMIYSAQCSAGSPKLQIADSTGAITCRFVRTTGEIEITAGTVADLSWTMVTCVHDDANDLLIVYVNGTQVGNASFTGTQDTGDATDFKLGGWILHSNNDYGGYLDEITFWNQTRNASDILSLFNNSIGCAFNFSSCSAAATIDITDNGIIPLNFTGGELSGFDSANAQEIETVKLNFSVSMSEDISSFYLNFTANGTNACSLGNKQSTHCYSFGGVNEWIQFKNNTNTDTFDSTHGTIGDFINVTQNGDSTVFDLVFFIDEHWNPNIEKGLYAGLPNFSDVQYETGNDQRIHQNNMIRVLVNDTNIPINADLYKLDFRASQIGAITQPLDAYMCNSTYSVGDPGLNANCLLVGQKIPSQFQDTDKFRALFTSALIQQLGDIRWVIFQHDESINSRYYALKTVAVTNASFQMNWDYSTDTGGTWANLSGYGSELNVNWIYSNQSNITEFIYELFINDTLGNSETSQGTMYWEINLTHNYPPLAEIVNPQNNVSLVLPHNITFEVEDPNGNNLNATLYVLYTNGTLHSILVTNMNQTNHSYYWDDSLSGEFDLRLEAKELTTPHLYSTNITHRIFINAAPSMTTPVVQVENLLTSYFTTRRSINYSSTYTDPDGDTGNVTTELLVNDIVTATTIQTSISNGTLVTGNFSFTNWSGDSIGSTLQIRVTGSDNVSSGDSNSSLNHSIKGSCIVSSTHDFAPSEAVLSSCTLNGDINYNDSVYLISQHSISFDGNNHLIRGNNSLNTNALEINTSFLNVNITNTRIINYSTCIWVNNFATANLLYNNHLTNCSVAGFRFINAGVSVTNFSHNSVNFSFRGIQGPTSWTTFNQNNITNNYERGIAFLASGITNSIIANNNINIHIDREDEIYINNTILTPSVTNDIEVVAIGSDYDVYLTNVSVDNSSIAFTGASNGFDLFRNWYLTGFVKDTAGNGLNASNYTWVPLGISSTVSGVLTNSSGAIPRQILTESLYQFNGQTHYNPYRFNASLDNYLGNSFNSNFTTNSQVNITLIGYQYNNSQNATAFESTTVLFSLVVFNIHGDVNATLNVNNTAQTVVETLVGNTYTFHSNYTVPLVTINDTNHSWSWNWTYTNSTGGLDTNTTEGNLSIFQAYLPLTFSLEETMIVENDNIDFLYNSTRYVDFATTKLIVERNSTNYSFDLTNSGNYSSVDSSILPGLNIETVENWTFFSWLNVTFNGTSLIRNLSSNPNQTTHKMILEACPGGNTTVPTLNFSYIDASTNAPINLSASSTLAFTTWKTTTSLTRFYGFTVDPNSNYDICISPEWGNFTSNYNIVARATGYASKSITRLSQTLNNITEQVSVTLSNSTTTSIVRILVLDENEDPYISRTGDTWVVNAWLYDGSTDTFSLFGSEFTDFLGSVSFNLAEVNFNYYKFNVTNNGVQKFETSRFKPTQSEYKFIINKFNNNVVNNIINLENGIEFNLTYSNVTNIVTLSWNDFNNVTTNVCLTIFNASISSWMNNVTYACSTSDVGTATYLVTNQSHIIAKATAFYIGDALEYNLDELEVDRRTTNIPFGKDGIFWGMLLQGTIMFIGFVGAGLIGGAIAGSFGLAIVSMFGLLSLSQIAITSIILVSLFVIIAKGKGS